MKSYLPNSFIYTKIFALKFQKRIFSTKLTNYFNFQAFEKAKFPVQPYTLILEFWDDDGAIEVEEHTHINEKTNEQFSVEKKEGEDEDKDFAGFFTVKIKRGMKTKAKKKN